MRTRFLTVFMVVTLFSSLSAVSMAGKDKGKGKELPVVVTADDPTFRLFQFLDTNRGGKLTDFYVIVNIYKNPLNPQEEFQRVARVVYGKDLVFGKLTLFLRTVAKMDPAQLKTYNPKEIYEFAESDTEKYTKTEAGPFGGKGDVYFHATDNGALRAVPVTDDVQKDYATLLTYYILPALGSK